MVSFSPFSFILDLFLPPRCLHCQKVVLTEKTLCPDCWDQANFITAPFCKCCGLPFEIDIPDAALCLNCARQHPPFKTARSVFPYDDFSKALILSFKHGDRTDLAPSFASWMHRAAQPQLESCDMIVPVPLHWRRLAKRRFNQAALLAHEIAKISGKKVELSLLKRIIHTPPQGHLSRMARQKNLKGAFKVIGNCQGKSILLIDDVLTTGATLINCTNALLKEGAREVHVVSIARVVQDHTTIARL